MSLAEDVVMFYRKGLTTISSSTRDDTGTVVKNHCPSNVSRRGRCDVLPQGLDNHIVLCERRYGDSSKKTTVRAMSLAEDVAMFYRKGLTPISSSARDDIGPVVTKPPAEQ